MKLLAILMAATLSATTATAQTVIVVRHADRAAEDDLIAAGLQRAQDLKASLAAAGVTLVITSDTKRARLTGAPTAQAAHAQTQELADPVAIAAAVRAAPPTSTVLVVGHSNTVPKIVQALGGPTLPDLADACFDRMFVIQLGGPRPKVVQTRYGAPSAC
jgi:phosphohistidine phosphatase SixA